MTERSGVILVYKAWGQREQYGEHRNVEEALQYADAFQSQDLGYPMAIIDYSTEPPTVLDGDDLRDEISASWERTKARNAEREPAPPYRGPLWRITVKLPGWLADHRPTFETIDESDLAGFVERYGDWATIMKVQ